MIVVTDIYVTTMTFKGNDSILYQLPTPWICFTTYARQLQLQVPILCNFLLQVLPTLLILTRF